MINVPFQLTAARLQLPSRPAACKKHKVAEPTNKKKLGWFQYPKTTTTTNQTLEISLEAWKCSKTEKDF
jgi:hypothetical protein